MSMGISSTFISSYNQLSVSVWNKLASVASGSSGTFEAHDILDVSFACANMANGVPICRFNGDATGVYSWRESINGAVDVAHAVDNEVDLFSGVGAVAVPWEVWMRIQGKRFVGIATIADDYRSLFSGKYSGASDITSIEFSGGAFTTPTLAVLGYEV